MKRTIKTVAAFMIASSVLFTSCVKNEVSDNVAALRAQQVAIVTANAELAAADAAYREAQVANLEMNNAQEALTHEQDLRRAIAQTDAYVAQQLAAVKQAELSLQQAVNNLADYIAEHQVENAQSYLNQYEMHMGQVNAYTVERIYKLADIAIAELMLEEGQELNGGNAIVLENDLAHAQAELAALEASLAAYAGINDDPASLSDAKDELKVEITNMETESSVLEIEMIGLESEADLADLELANSETFIDEFESGESDIMDLESDIEGYNDAITGYNEDIVDYNEDIVDLEADIVDKTAVYDDLMIYRAAKDAAQDDIDAAQADVDAAQVDVDFAQARYNDDPSAANQTALDNAQDALSDANDDLNDANADASLPNQNYNIAVSNAGGDEDFVMGQIEGFQDDIVDLEEAIETANEDIASSNEDIAEANFDIDRIEATLTSGQANYDAALLALAGLNDASNAAWAAYNEKSNEVDAITIMIDALWDVYNVVDGDMDNIEDIIMGKETSIAGKKDDIAGIEAQMTLNNESEIDLQATLDDYNEDLAEIDASIAEHQELADKWKALLDAALGN